MNNTSNKFLTPYSKKLRKEMTKEERKLWYDFLKALNITVSRQKVIGNYIVDFCCSKAKLIIELDGSQHYDESNIMKDRIRDEYLSKLGFTILRYTNEEIHSDFYGVCTDIMKHLPENTQFKSNSFSL